MVHWVGVRKDVELVVARRQDVISTSTRIWEICAVRLPADSLGRAGVGGYRREGRYPTPTNAGPGADACTVSARSVVVYHVWPYFQPFTIPSNTCYAPQHVTMDRSTLTESHSSPADMPSSTAVIRPLASLAEYGECVALQYLIWGEAYEAVPAAVLQVSTHVGGITAGAFDKDGLLVGFVFGLTGPDGSNIIHWSHMLGVRGARQNAGVGRMLKDYQRKELARRQIGEMYWTYDPLIAKNAHFNLNVLGVRVVRFVPNHYGISNSPLHHGLPTDRFVVVCETARELREVSPVLDAGDAGTPLLTASPQAGDPVFGTGDKRAPRVRLEIPTDFAKLLVDAPVSAERWHSATRDHLLWAVANDYTVTGFRRDATTSRSFYILELSS